MRILLPIFLALSFCAKGQGKNNGLSGSYVGLWAQTFWIYKFTDEHSFTFSTRMHFGNTDTDGQYSISGDTIFLKLFRKEQQKDTFSIPIMDILLKSGGKCLTDKRGYEYCIHNDSDTIYTQAFRQ